MNFIKRIKIKLKGLLSKNRKNLLISILFRIELFIYFFIFFPFLCINRLLKKNKRLYFASFYSNRIGHFAPGFHIRFAKKKLKLEKKNCLYCFNEKVANNFFAKQVKKYFYINRTIKFIIIICQTFPWLNCLVDEEPLNSLRDIKGYTQKVKMPAFSYSENNFCINWLKKSGWEGPSQKLICIHVRDSSYLDKVVKKGKFKNNDFKYHSYRDSNIDLFSESIYWLIDQNAFVIRTGKTAYKEAKINSNNFLDYPFCDNQNDLIDIWLFANADLVISTGSGIDEVAGAYRVPRIYLNLLPFIDTPSWSRTLTIPKHLYWKSSKKHLQFEEYIKLKNISTTKEFINKGIEITSLSRKEILEVIKDGWAYYLDNKPFKENDIKFTNEFKKYLMNDSLLNNYHEFLNKDWVISSNIF